MSCRGCLIFRVRSLSEKSSEKKFFFLSNSAKFGISDSDALFLVFVAEIGSFSIGEFHGTLALEPSLCIR